MTVTQLIDLLMDEPPDNEVYLDTGQDAVVPVSATTVASGTTTTYIVH